MVKPYFPDIVQNCVRRVNDSFSNRTVDPFSVFFDKGIIQQVRRTVYAAQQNFPLVWLVFKYDEIFGNPRFYSSVSFEVVIAMPTDNTYTQQQRDDISYKPRLLPIADQLIAEIQREYEFSSPGIDQLKYLRKILPYWGQGDVNGTDADNLFKRKIDAISLKFTDVLIKNPKNNCLIPRYNVLDTNFYPIMNTPLTFYDDLELIVDGGNPNDPIAGTNSILIPFLIGKDYEVVQRSQGQLREKRNAEFVPDLVNGGFALTGDLEFSTGDTYFIRIRPQYI